ERVMKCVDERAFVMVIHPSGLNTMMQRVAKCLQLEGLINIKFEVGIVQKRAIDEVSRQLGIMQNLAFSGLKSKEPIHVSYLFSSLS
ncbi:MAG: hypothetical protein KJ922_04895, partial [Nanoarchaeota archaeon]|nr:hypothetical protein [Nanoarchaeota archaeon]